MTNKLLLEDIKALYKKYKKKRKFPAHDKYLLRFNKAEALLDTVLKATTDSEIRGEARKNHIVSHVTAIELFCIETILNHRGKWKDEGLTSLLSKKDNFNLNDVFELFKIGKITKEHLLIKYYSFQNAGAIDRVFSILTGETIGDKFKFFENLCRMKISEEGFRSGTTINSLMPDWRKYFNILFETRHKIIHEDDNTPIKKVEFNKMIDASDHFTWACFVRFELEGRF